MDNISEKVEDSSSLNIDQFEIPDESYDTDGEEEEDENEETEDNGEDTKQLEEGNLKRKNESKDVKFVVFFFNLYNY